MKFPSSSREPEAPPAFAVLDPRLAGNREMIAVLGTDAVELESHRLSGPEHHPCFRVKFAALTPGRQVAVCRMLARRHGLGFQRAFHEAVQGRGLSVCAHGCYVCADPEVGRAYFAERGREGGDG